MVEYPVEQEWIDGKRVVTLVVAPDSRRARYWIDCHVRPSLHTWVAPWTGYGSKGAHNVRLIVLDAHDGIPEDFWWSVLPCDVLSIDYRSTDADRDIRRQR